MKEITQRAINLTQEQPMNKTTCTRTVSTGLIGALGIVAAATAYLMDIEADDRAARAQS
jgi:hypothetical protein